MSGVDRAANLCRPFRLHRDFPCHRPAGHPGRCHAKYDDPHEHMETWWFGREEEEAMWVLAGKPPIPYREDCRC